MNIYEIAKEYVEAVEKLQDLNLPAEVILDTMEEIEFDLKDKIEAYGYAILNLETVADKKREVAAQLVEQAKTMEARADMIRANVLSVVQHTGFKLPVKYGAFNVSVAKMPKSAIIHDEAAVPSGYKTVVETVKIDKREILAALKGGATIDGCSLSEDDYRLVIK